MLSDVQSVNTSISMINTHTESKLVFYSGGYLAVISKNILPEDMEQKCGNNTDNNTTKKVTTKV